MSSAQQYCLRWNNHSSNFITVFDQLLRTESFTDVTVAVHDGQAIKCHKMVLAACSSYFQDLFIKNPCEHPIIILSDVRYIEIKAILDYMYRGEVNVAQDQLAGLLKVASFLKVKGLVEDPENHKEDGDTEMSPPPSNSTSTPSSQSLGSGYVSPTHIPTSTYIPYGKSPIERNHNHIPLWTALTAALPLPQHPISGPPPRSQHSILGTSYDSPPSELSPLGRKKLSALMARDTPILRNVLGQAQVDAMVDRQDASLCSNSNGSLHDSDRRNSADLSESMMEDEDSKYSPPYANINGTSKQSNKSTTAKPEWKRYKQYTREHIQDAMDAVRNKEMSALQAARRYGVPSRTLYDKLKKAGILPSRGLGISRQRDTTSITDSSSARFPYSSSVNDSVYGSSALSESESETKALHNGSLVMDMSTRSPSPNRSASVFVTPVPIDNQNDQVEDLSVGKSNGNNATPVIVPVPATATTPIKQEQQPEVREEMV